MKRSYYSNKIEYFLEEDNKKIIGELTLNHAHKLDELQRNAWLSQTEFLKQTLQTFDGYLFYEFSIPRMGKRVDNILIINDIIFVIEFKVGSENYDKHALDQVIDYSLDLKNFHEGSHKERIIPILVSTEAKSKENKLINFDDNLYHPLLSNKFNFEKILRLSLQDSSHYKIDPVSWENSIYKPTPTIIEAAQALYKGHNVKEISRSDSGAKNLTQTANCISKIIEFSKNNDRKSICFVTGVPGAGKTLAGLNIANERTKIAEDEHAVFLSGNGPLVDVLREALARDKVLEEKENNIKITKSEARSQVKSFIQNIHHFRDDALRTLEPPIEKVAVFDEAQRAWTAHQASKFMQQKKGVSGFNMSEPEFLIEVMDRHKNWCSIICLIGGGQEINTGEAGLEEWVRAFEDRFNDWDIYFSTKIITDKNYLKDHNIIENIKLLNSKAENDLHLAVSVRSFRSEMLSDFVQKLIDLNLKSAKEIYENNLKEKYPIAITRNLSSAREWLKSKARGSERYGLTASSGANRLKPFGINIKEKIDAPIWFLNEKEDIRSSYFLEDVATEFDIQGLELDWICLAWDGDLHYNGTKWVHQKFKGTKWQNINKKTNIDYLINAYRVLLTRARQGMIFYIPYGNNEDKTRQPKFYDNTYSLFRSLGIEEVK